MSRTSNSIGAFGEKLAARYLLRHGYLILCRNYRAGHHEIDLVVRSLRSIAFVEVKTRSYPPGSAELLPPPGRAIDSDKKSFTRQAARQYLYEHPTRLKPRMDVIEIWLEEQPVGAKPRLLRLRHLKEAY